MKEHFLFMIMIGCTPKGRVTEQHDVFFGIAPTLFDLKEDIVDFWPEAKGQLHIDAWQKVTQIDGFHISIVERETDSESKQNENLFFINLGGYKENEFEEYHYKVLSVASSKAEAIKNSKQTTFYKHCGFKGATSHIDDKYGIDVDDIHKINDILSSKFKNKFQIHFEKAKIVIEDQKHIGYLKFDKIQP